ncbi:MAG: PLP-dependent aminotransferase family protein [Candidatus Odinarchaeota archaeon]|nr:PLP-dependent aminotransferase family protein [Candidatus Odinarchaeota archaeon]
MTIRPVFDFAEWTQLISESEIRRLLAYNVPYYYAGGKPGVLPLTTLSKILINTGTEQLIALTEGHKDEVIEAYNYGQTAGWEPLRRTFAKRLREKDNINLDPEEGWKDVIITTGSQQSIYLILDALISPGDVIITPKPVYLGFVNPAVKFGANVIAVATDEYGIVPEYIEKTIQIIEKEKIFKKLPEILYVIPDSDNPKGTTLPTKRRKALYDIAVTYNMLIIEDAAYREIQFTDNRLPTIKSFDKENTHVAYLRTTSKEAATLRVGYSVMPEPLKEQVLKAKGYVDLCTPTLIQYILNEYYSKYIDNVLPEIVTIYHRRAKAMIEAIDETFPPGKRSDPTGGFFVWWESDKKDFNAKIFLEKEAIPNGIAYVPGSAFYPPIGYQFSSKTEKISKIEAKYNTMRLSFSYKTSQNISFGIRKLGELLSKKIGK